MAKFLKVHHRTIDNDVYEVSINLEQIVSIDEEEHDVDMSDGESIHIDRSNEWNKLMSYVIRNSYEG